MAEQDVLDLLRAQHARIEELFRQVSGSEGEQRRDLFEDLVRLLAVHETAEEELVHPVSRRYGVGDEVVDARLGEELDAKELLGQIYDLGSDHPDFPAQLIVLRDAVLRHAKREERYEFPYLQQNLPMREREQLGAAVQAAERFAPTRPHPQLQSVVANVVAGPPMAVVDRVRDAIRDAMR